MVEEVFEKTKKEAEDAYKDYAPIFCPYLKTKVRFNAKGLDHIKMKAWNKSRAVSDQYLRLKFLCLVPEVLAVAGTLQEYQEKNNFERVKSTGEWQMLMKPVRYFAFVAIVKRIKIKIVIKKVDNGEPYFWSVIPFWKTQKDEMLQATKKVFHEGDLEKD
jgi:hypothetical protein